MQRVLEQIEAHYKEREITGKGVTVAVLDTGCGRHPDIMGRILCFQDFVKGGPSLYDDSGHGTHVCGIICGNGSLSGGKYRGIAPGAELVVCKVLDRNGDGSTENMLEALKWVVANRERYRIRVLNISVGIGELKEPEKKKALRQAIEAAWNKGITVICAAGNKGPEDGSISSIGGSEKVITVGCHDGTFCLDNPNRCATYSGRGSSKSVLRKPDIVAPGTDILSCNAFYRHNTRHRQAAYVKKSGTSMATPIVSGAVALMLSVYPHMSNEEVRKKLTRTAVDLGEACNVQGWGMVNIRKILE